MIRDTRGGCGGNAAGKPFELTMADLRTQFKPVELVAVNQCSGNSRGLFSPRVTGGQLTWNTPVSGLKFVYSYSFFTTLATDGPFPEAKELLAGYRLVDVETPGRAIEIA